MNFELAESQNDLAGLVRKIASDQVDVERLKSVEAGKDHFDRTLWAALASAGVLAAALPEPAGGGGYGLPEQCSVLIELGRTVAAVPYLDSIAVAASAVAQYGTAAQIATWAEPAATGDLVLTAALVEDGTDPFSPLTRAERDGAGWRLNGTKTAVPAGTVAGGVLVPAVTPDGIGVFMVTPADPGVSLVAQRTIDGAAHAVLELSSAVVDADRLIGGADLLETLLARETVGLCALQVGVLERVLELTVEYARTREQFGRAIGSFQAVTQRLADAYIDVEGARLTLWQAAWRVAEGLPAAAEIATAKFWAADAGHRVAHTAVHVHGGTGIDVDHATHRYFTAAKTIEFTLGGATAQLLRIGAELADIPA